MARRRSPPRSKRTARNGQRSFGRRASRRASHGLSRTENPCAREDQKMSFRTWCGAVTGVVLFVLNSAAMALDWPTRSMLVVSPVTAGNAGDIVARIVLEQVSKQIGQSFVIENRPGAGTNIATEAVVNASPDGYTLLFATAANALGPALYPNLKYDFIRDT